jgi:hypothetical protein
MHEFLRTKDLAFLFPETKNIYLHNSDKEAAQ